MINFYFKDFYYICKIKRTFDAFYKIYLLKQFFLIFIFLLIVCIIQAQSDTSFWFAAPDIQGNGSTPPQDEPIYLKLGAGTLGAKVDICIPAASKCTTVTVNPNSNLPVNLTAWKASLETTPNSAQNKGLYIKSNNKITAYYEPGSPWSTEIFSLKGKNALGKDFYVPFQTFYQSGGDAGHTAYGSIVFGATEDNTKITITPTKDLINHLAASGSFDIILNKGQTYALKTTGTGKTSNPAGTHIISDKSITVTIDDDNLMYGSCYDLAGDQIVPNTQAGQDYVFVNSGLREFPSTDPYAMSDANFGDRFYIMGTEDNTQIQIYKYTAGGTNPPTTTVTATINKGQQYEFVYNIAIGGKFLPISTFMHATKPVTVLQMSGISCEASAAVLPPVGCTGSQDINFNVNNYGSSSNSGLISIFLITKDGNQSGFKLEINGKDKTSSIPVFFVNKGGYATAIVTFQKGQIENDLGIPFGQNALCRITNSKGIFHAGLFEAAEGTVGASYGYFSDYNKSGVTTDINTFNGCSVQIDLSLTKPSATNIHWSTGETTPKITTSLNVVFVSYDDATCAAVDTFKVHRSVPTDLGPDKAFCPNNGETVTLDATHAYAKSYKWSTNETTAKITTNKIGIYTVSVTIAGPCTQTKSIRLKSSCQVSVNIIPSKNPICFGDSVTLVADASGGDQPYKFLWNTGSTNDTIQVKLYSDSTFKVTVTDANPRVDSSEVKIIVNHTTVSSFNDKCSNDKPFALTGGNPVGGTYMGQGISGGLFDPASASTGLNKIIYSINGCKDSNYININHAPTVDAGKDVVICAGDSTVLTSNGTGTSFQWSPTNETTASIKVAPVTITMYFVTATDNGCSNKDSVTVDLTTRPQAEAGKDTALCEKQIIQLTASGGLNNFQYKWSTHETTPVITVSPAQKKTFSVTVYNGLDCFSKDTIVVDVYSIPIAYAGQDTTICQGSIAKLNGSGGVLYMWSDSQIGSQISVTPQVTTTYKLSVSSIHNCKSVDTVIVHVISTPSPPQMDDVTICLNEKDSAVLVIQNPNPSYIYKWFGSVVGNDSIGFGSNLHVKNINISQSKYIGVFTKEGCTGTSRKQVNVNVGEIPVASISVDPLPVWQRAKVRLIDSTKSKIISWIWSLGQRESSMTGKEIYYSYDEPGKSTVKLMVKNADYCKDTTELELDVLPIIDIFVPDAFTPNDDGKNDMLWVRGPVVTMKFYVYNQWGFLVFSTEKQSEGWDGKYNGQTQPEGNYVFKLTVTTVYYKTLFLQGIVSLIR